MAVLTTNWAPTSRFAPADGAVVTPRDGETATPADDAAPARAKSDRPIVIYVKPVGESEGFDKIDKVVLQDDKVAIGLKFFQTLQMTPEDASNDPLLAGKGKEAPRFLFVSPDYKDVTVLEGGKVSVSGFFKSMAGEAKKWLDCDFDKNVKEIRDLMNEWDKISKERSVLEEKEKREDKPTPADKAKMEKAKAELDARQQKADERKAELMKIALKGATA